MPEPGKPKGQMMSRLGRAGRWAVWILAGGILDLAAWSQLRDIRVLDENPGLASALTLCWVHVFLLPPLFGQAEIGQAGVGQASRAGHRVRQVFLCMAIGIVAAPVALVIGAVAGLNAGAVALLIGLAMGPGTGAVYHPPSEPLDTVLNVLSDLLLWSGLVIGSAVAATVCVGLSALAPGLPRPRLSWRVLVGAGCAAIVLAPDWVVGFRQFPLREPAFLLTAALPSLILVNWRSITRTQSA